MGLIFLAVAGPFVEEDNLYAPVEKRQLLQPAVEDAVVELRDRENLRIVEIEKMDYSACGGIHVGNTAEIGYIKISGYEKIRGNIRIRAFIGARADEYFRSLTILESDLKQELQTETVQILSRIEMLKADISRTIKQMQFYRKEYIDNQVNKIAAETGGKKHLVFRRDDLDIC